MDVDTFMNLNGSNFWSTYHDPGGYNPAFQLNRSPFHKDKRVFLPKKLARTDPLAAKKERPKS